MIRLQAPTSLIWKLVIHLNGSMTHGTFALRKKPRINAGSVVAVEARQRFEHLARLVRKAADLTLFDLLLLLCDTLQ